MMIFFHLYLFPLNSDYLAIHLLELYLLYEHIFDFYILNLIRLIILVKSFKSLHL